MRKQPPQTAKGPPTTLLIRNLPRRYTDDDLLQEIESVVGVGLIDFLHVPLEGAVRNKAFGVVNFTNPDVARRALDLLQGRRWCHAERAKPARVLVADVQGMAANLERAEHVVSREGSATPLIFLGGRPVKFQEALRSMLHGASARTQAPSPAQVQPEEELPKVSSTAHEQRQCCRQKQQQEEAGAALDHGAWRPQRPEAVGLSQSQQQEEQGAERESKQDDQFTHQTSGHAQLHQKQLWPTQTMREEKHQTQDGDEDDEHRELLQKQEVQQLRQLQWLLRARLQNLSQHQRPRCWAPLPANTGDGVSSAAASREAWEAYTDSVAGASHAASAHDGIRWQHAEGDRLKQQLSAEQIKLTDAGAPAFATKEVACSSQSFSTDAGRFAEERSDVDDLEPKYVSVSFEMPIVQELPDLTERANIAAETLASQNEDGEGLAPYDEADSRLGRNPGYRKALQDFHTHLKELIRRYCAAGGAAACGAGPRHCQSGVA